MLRLLVNRNAAGSFGAPELPKVAWAVEQSAERLVGASLRRTSWRA